MLQFEKVTMPKNSLPVHVLDRVAPAGPETVLSVRVTSDRSELTTLPAASSTATTGWGRKGDPLTPFPGCSKKTN